MVASTRSGIRFDHSSNPKYPVLIQESEAVTETDRTQGVPTYSSRSNTISAAWRG